MEKNDIFFNSNSDSGINVYARAYNLRYVEDNHKGNRIAFLDFSNCVLIRKNNDFAELKVHPIHRKYVPLLHNTVVDFIRRRSWIGGREYSRWYQTTV